MLKPTVSCIVAACNAERFLAATLDSICAQQGATLEVIVVDDGSTDGTLSIAAGSVDRCGSSARPTPATRRHAIAESRQRAASLSPFRMQTTCALRTSSQVQLAAFAEEPALEVCAAHVQNFRGNMLPEGDPFPGYNTEMLVRREVFDRLGLFAEGLQHAARLEWMLRARKAGVRECLLPQTLMFRRLHETNRSYLHANESLREYLHVLRHFVTATNLAKPHLLRGREETTRLFQVV